MQAIREFLDAPTSQNLSPQQIGGAAAKPSKLSNISIPGLVIRSLKTEYVVTALCLFLVTYLSIANHFVQDDGFITLRYVDNFLRGHGPVWSPGSTEFGYTNFLFMLLVTLLSSAGLDPIVSANVVSYSSFFTSVTATYLIARRLTSGNGIVAGLVVAVIFSNFTVSSYASGLLETSLQLALVTLTFLFVLACSERLDRVRFVHLATATATLGMLTRLDTVLLIAPAFLLLFLKIWAAEPGTRGRAIKHTTIALACAALVLSAFLVFCHLFYGQALPTTFDAKAGQNLEFGWLYLSIFMIEEFFVYPYLLAIILLHWYRTVGRLPRLHKASGYTLALAAAAATWTAYTLYIGGGFMGYRLMIPFIVIFFLLAFTAMGNRFGTVFTLQMAVIVMLTQAGQYFWFSRLDNSLGRHIETPTGLHWHVTRPRTNWQIIGLRLNDLFYTGTTGDIMIAVRAAGAIPYHSRLPTYDIHGLNTREVIDYGARTGIRPGHQLWATSQQMEEAGVHLIVSGHVCDRDVQAISEGRPEEAWLEYPAVLIPLQPDGCWAVSYYVQQHPAIESRIRQGEVVRVDPLS